MTPDDWSLTATPVPPPKPRQTPLIRVEPQSDGTLLLTYLNGAVQVFTPTDDPAPDGLLFRYEGRYFVGGAVCRPPR